MMHIDPEVLVASLRRLQTTSASTGIVHQLEVVIERAVGYLMGKHDLTAAQAFTGLRKQARDSRRRVADLAAEVLGEGTGELL
ncbi:AmiR/NasT family two-component response regulator [Streptosporangium album]|uniref:AmiR/NasT family two-component response regulator n=1 Tax=Streptosporangium album TaxID=47479 RepID=A0A7W7RU08_9ACTN|nr:ANTAR domain-containing protein [Streptosporangium album]MBB4938102.1 AmiR/NasT family two-component response regulator [Streptosporangium album]